jgi:hypothetical protein
MEEIISTQTGRDVLMSRLSRWVQEERYEEASSALEQFLRDEPQDRECRLLRLLFEIKLHGLTLHEHEVEEIGSFSDLGPREKIIAKHIFALTSEELAKEGPTDRVLAYQRVVRRLFPESFVPASLPPPGMLIDFTYIREGILRVVSRPMEYISPAVRQGASRLRRRIGERVGRVLSVTGSPPAGELGWRWGGILGVVALTSLFMLRHDPGKATTANRADVPAIRQVASLNRVLGVKDLGFEVWGENRDPNLTEQLARWSEAHVTKLLPLYDKRVKSHPDLMGSIVLHLKVDASGSVVQVAEVQSRLKDPEFRDAVVQQAYQWKFAGNHSEPLEIEYPLLFVPGGMDPMTLVRWELTLATRAQEEKGRQASQAPENGTTVEPEAVQEPALVSPLPADRNDTPDEPAPTISNGVAKHEEPKPASNGRSVAKSKRKPAALTLKLPVANADPSPAEMLVEPVADRETPAEGLGVYKARITTAVRENRGFGAPTLETIAAGTEVNILEAKGEWFRVRTNGGTGKTGYVRKEFVVPAQR